MKDLTQRGLQAAAKFLLNAQPWPLSVILLSLACYPIAWVCAASGAAGKMDDVAALTATLIFLFALDPFFMRRNYRFNGIGLLLTAGAGLLIAFIGWLFSTNFIVLVWMGMTYGLTITCRPTERGERMRQQIEFEQATRTGYSRWINPPSEQGERMLAVRDFALVVVVVLIILWVVDI